LAAKVESVEIFGDDERIAIRESSERERFGDRYAGAM